MSVAPDLREIVAYHEAMGLELADFIVMANAGEPLSVDDRRSLVEASIARMLADIRDNLNAHGAPVEVIAVLCDASNRAFEQRLKALNANSYGGAA